MSKKARFEQLTRRCDNGVIQYYLFEVEVKYHGRVYLVSEGIGDGWMKILRDPCSSLIKNEDLEI